MATRPFVRFTLPLFRLTKKPQRRAPPANIITITRRVSVHTTSSHHQEKSFQKPTTTTTIDNTTSTSTNASTNNTTSSSPPSSSSSPNQTPQNDILSSSAQDLNPIRDEYSKTGGDDVVARQVFASYSREHITPESAQERAGRGMDVNPLEMSPAALEASYIVEEKVFNSEASAAAAAAGVAGGKGVGGKKRSVMGGAVKGKVVRVLEQPMEWVRGKGFVVGEGEGVFGSVSGSGEKMKRKVRSRATTSTTTTTTVRTEKFPGGGERQTN